MYYVYMIRNSANRLYIGISQNPKERVIYHNNRLGAKFTKYIGDFKIVFLENHSNLQLARQREVQIKKWRREKKDLLINRFINGLETKV